MNIQTNSGLRNRVIEQRIKLPFDDSDIEYKEPNLDFRLTRGLTELSTVSFFMDGFEKQGNSSLRTIFLRTFSEIGIDNIMMHDVKACRQGIRKNDGSFFTLRNIEDTLISAISVNITKQHNASIDIKNFITIFNKHIKRYSKILDFMISHIDTINRVLFEDIEEMSNDYLNNNIHNNQIIKNVSQKFNLKINTNSRLRYIQYESSKNEEIKKIIELSYFQKRIKKLNIKYDVLKAIQKERNKNNEIY